MGEGLLEGWVSIAYDTYIYLPGRILLGFAYLLYSKTIYGDDDDNILLLIIIIIEKKKRRRRRRRKERREEISLHAYILWIYISDYILYY